MVNKTFDLCTCSAEGGELFDYLTKMVKLSEKKTRCVWRATELLVINLTSVCPPPLSLFSYLILSSSFLSFFPPPFSHSSLLLSLILSSSFLSFFPPPFSHSSLLLSLILSSSFLSFFPPPFSPLLSLLLSFFHYSLSPHSFPGKSCTRYFQQWNTCTHIMLCTEISR